MSNTTMTNSTVSEATGQPEITGAARHLHEDGLIAIAWAGCATAAFFLLLRLYARWREAARLFFDDYWMILGFVFLFCNAILQTLQTPSLYYIMNISAGRIAVGPELLVQGNIYVRYEFVIIAFFWSTTWSVKGSFLALYYRLFDGLPQYRRMWWAAVCFSICAYIGCWMASVWTCHPPSTYFQFGIVAHCLLAAIANANMFLQANAPSPSTNEDLPFQFPTAQPSTSSPT
jgi:hypothetical protein